MTAVIQTIKVANNSYTIMTSTVSDSYNYKYTCTADIRLSL